MDNNLYKKLAELSSGLIFLDSAELKSFLESVKNLPDSASEELLNILKEAKQKQDSFLREKEKTDPQFLQKLGTFLEGEIRVIKSSAKLK